MQKYSKLLLILILFLFGTQTTFAGRYYDSKTGRFLQVDPKAHKYPGWSPYNYTLNNPLRNIDPDGKEPITVGGVAVSAGAIYIFSAATLAAGVHSYKMVTDANYRRNAISFGNVVGNAVSTAFSEVSGLVGKLFNSDEAKEKSNEPRGAQTKEQLEKAKGSYEGLVTEHKEKLEEYKNNPEGSDNKETLKNAKPEHREKIINGRIRAIEKQISKQQKELDKINEALKKYE